MNQIEICLTPALLPYHESDNKIVVLVDILRATSSICTAFARGVKEIIPVGTEEEAKKFKDKGFIVAGERNGVVLDFADFGNSPFNFMNHDIKDKTIAYCTTNGTKAIKQAGNCYKLYIGSFLNISILNQKLIREDKDVMILCSGWKNRFNIEDSLFAGALADALLTSGKFSSNCDSVTAMADLWHLAKNNLRAYIDKSAHRTRLKNLKLDDVIDYCLTPDTAEVLPVLSGEIIINEANL
jgi:2-phosphosulfolactate phosphatase